MNPYQLAEINVANFREPVDHPVNRDFLAALSRVNAIADASDGFVWRLAEDGGDARYIRAYNDPNIAVNMSVWRDFESLAAFTYRNSEHLAIMRRRKEWFNNMELYFALWWVPAGYIPNVEEGKARLERLRHLGPHKEAFTFRTPFSAPDPDAIEQVFNACD